jgi:hypothetical protein
MISYPHALSEYQAAQTAAQDTENWNEKEREALRLIYNFGIWHQEMMEIANKCPAFPTSIFEKAIEEHLKKCPDVSVGDSPFGKRFTVHPGKHYSLTFYIRKAASGYNIGIKNCNIR